RHAQALASPALACCAATIPCALYSDLCIHRDTRTVSTRKRHGLRQSSDKFCRSTGLECSFVSSCIQHNSVEHERADLRSKGHEFRNENGSAGRKPTRFFAPSFARLVNSTTKLLGVEHQRRIDKRMRMVHPLSTEARLSHCWVRPKKSQNVSHQNAQFASTPI